MLARVRTIQGRLGLNIGITVLGIVIIAFAVLCMVRAQILQDRRDKVQSIVEMAAGVMADLERQVQAGKLTRDQAMTQFIAIDENLRYDGGNYVAVYDLQGTVRAFPGGEKLVGVNRIDLTDSDGVKIVREAIDIVNQSGEGFYHYRYPKPGETTNPAPKMSFVKGFAPWGVYLISGIYIDDVDNTLLHFGLIFGAAALPLLLIVAGFTVALRRSIGSGLGRLSESLRKLAAGDLDASVEGRERSDEIGGMALAVESLKAAAVAKRALEVETADHRAAAERERAENERERAEAASQQRHVMEALARGLTHLAEGDVSFRLENAFAADYETVRTDFNGAMDKLQETMTVVATNAAAIRTGSTEISAAADDLSRRTEQQAASLEQTAAALDEITATVKKTSDGAVHARQVVSAAKADAEHSGQVVGRAVQAMTAIEQSSQQVSQIIGVIDEIAFQTNLLALNAGVEAARAGDAGRGFAVVASEVRALAQRSAEAAKEIKALISTSTAQVGEGVGLVSETGKALSRIAEQVAEINTVVSVIATSAEEQAAGLGQVNTAVNQMDQVTQQNAAMVEQSTAASHNLSREAEELARLIDRFHLGRKTASENRRPERGTDRSSRSPVPALKTAGRSGAARKPEVRIDEAGWEEF